VTGCSVMSACSRLQPPCNGSTGQVPRTELLKTIVIHRNTHVHLLSPQPGMSWLGMRLARRTFAASAAKSLFWGGESLRETWNREQETCRVPQVFPEHVPEPLRECPSLEKSCDFSGEIFRERNYCPRTAFSGKKFARF